MVELMREILNSGVVDRVGWTLVHSVWEGVAMGIIVWVALRTMKRGSAGMRYATASAGLALMVLLVAGTCFFMPGTLRMPLHEAARNGGGEKRFAAEPQSNGGRTENDGTAASALNVATVTAEIPLRERLVGAVRGVEPVFPWMVGIWTLGVLSLSVWHIGGWAAMQRMRRIGVTPAGERVGAMVLRMRKQLEISRIVRVMASALVNVPMVIGHFRPLILVPVTMITGMPTEQLEAILAHELAHVRRHDYAINLLQVTVETLLFYHPAVWWISRQIRQEREHSCDDLAAAVGGDRLVYAEALVSVASLRETRNGLAMAANRGTMLLRIQRVLGIPKQENSRRPASLAAIVAAMVLIALPLINTHHSAKAQGPATAPAGEIVIRGKVLETGSEKPVVGALVIAGCITHAAVQMTTDGEGVFTCTVPKGTWQVEFRDVGSATYLSAPTEPRLSAAQIPAEGTQTIVLHIPPVLPVGGIHGKLLMPDGLPAAGILVVPSAENDSHTIGSLIYLNAKKAASDGTFAFPTAPAGAPVHLYAETKDHTLAFFAEVQTKPRLGDQDVGTFTLQPTVSADVLITDAHREPLPNTMVNVEPTFGDNGLGNQNHKFTTDDQGHLQANGLLPGMQYKISRRGKKPHVNVVLVGTAKSPAVSQVTLDDFFSMQVIDSAGKPVPIADIHSIMVTMDDKAQWQEGPQPQIDDRLADETVLIDPVNVILAHPGNLVTMHFTSKSGEEMIATGAYGLLSGMQLAGRVTTPPGVTLSSASEKLAPDQLVISVFDPQGHPLNGATVSIPDFDPPFMLGKMKVLGATGEDGVLKIANATPRFFYLQIDKAGFARRWLLIRGIPKGRAFDVRLDNTTHLTADIRLPDGTPGTGAVLTAVTNLERLTDDMPPLTGFQATMNADANGHVDMMVTPGEWDIRIRYKEGYFARLMNVEIRQGETAQKMITLTPGVHLRVHAVDSVTKNPLLGAKFFIEENYPGEAGPLLGSERTTDADGVADWAAVMPGAQFIECSADGYVRHFCDVATWPDQRGIDAIPLNIIAGMPDVTVRMEAGMRLTGKVVDESGKPLAKVFVNVFGLSTGDARFMRPTNGNGEFELVVPQSNGFQQTNYKLGVATQEDPYHPKVLTEEFTPVSGGTKSFVIILPKSP